MVVARKGKITKKFTSIAWTNLGENKNGWVEVNPTPVVNTAPEKKTPPPNGDSTKQSEKTVTVDNTAEAEEKKQDEVEVDNSATATSEAEAESEFSKLAKANLNKAQIKDYLDAKELTYKSNSSLDALVGTLSTLFNGDVETLKKEFNLKP